MSISKQLGVLAARASHEKRGGKGLDMAGEAALGLAETGGRAAILSAIAAPLLRILSRGRIRAPSRFKPARGTLADLLPAARTRTGLQRALGTPGESLRATMENIKKNPITKETLKPWAPLSASRDEIRLGDGLARGSKPSYLSALAQSSLLPLAPALDPTMLTGMAAGMTNKYHGVYDPIIGRSPMSGAFSVPEHGLPYFATRKGHWPRIPFSFIDKHNANNEYWDKPWLHDVPYHDRMTESEAVESEEAGFPSTRASDWRRTKDEGDQQ